MGQKLDKSQVKAVGFDVDGTLYHSTPQMHEWIGGEIIRLGAAKFDKPLEQFAREYEARLAEVGGNTKTLDSLGLKGSAIFGQIWDEMPLEQFIKPDARLLAVLNELSRRYKLFILSNGSESQVQHKLEMLGLSEVGFEFVLCCYDHGWAKPDRAPFDYALEQLGLPPENVIYVGDREEVDVVGSMAANMLAILVGGKGETRAQARVETVYDIVSVL